MINDITNNIKNGRVSETRGGDSQGGSRMNKPQELQSLVGQSSTTRQSSKDIYSEQIKAKKAHDLIIQSTNSGRAPKPPNLPSGLHSIRNGASQVEKDSDSIKLPPISKSNLYSSIQEHGNNKDSEYGMGQRLTNQ